MARPPRDTKKVRLNLELSLAQRDTLERLREVTDADSLAEVIRRSLGLYDLARRLADGGGWLVVRDADGERELALPEFERLKRARGG